MHGLILSELRRFLHARLGEAAWPALVEKARVGRTTYLISETYPDAEVVALVTTASQITGVPAGALLEDFGEFIVPTLLKTYRAFVKPTWRTLDVLEHTEQNIHKAVRLRDAGAEPPRLHVTRPNPDEVQIVYRSERKLCAVAKGIVNGIAKHYGDAVEVAESTCMVNGDPACTINVRAVSLENS